MDAKSQIMVTLPDGSKREFATGATGEDVAGSIGPGLLKAALAVKVNGELRDLKRPIDQDADIAIITARENEGLELLRHDAAHVLAEAVQELFPGTQVTIGPVIEDGFFYDFARDEPFRVDDLAAIEEKMREIVARDEPITREVWDRGEAIDHFRSIGETYKAEIIEDLPEGEPITIYRQGKWYDLCRGPHLPSTGKLGDAFKLLKVAGAYWRGDSRNAMLSRIYGTCWRDKKELKAYLHRIEEAEKRDHRKLGKELALFHFQEEAPGMPFWHPNGWTVYQQLEAYIRKKQIKGGYQEIRTPQLVDRSLWEKSGHWEKFGEHIYSAITADEKQVAIKPMNCPCHVQVFNHHLHSYRDLPLRYAEFGSCHRYEPSGALHGLMRVRAFTQDDGHIFCTRDQITSEAEIFTRLLFEIYRELGFEQVRVKFSDRPEIRAGADDVWDQAETALKEACEQMGLEFEYNPGEGAFYGPKLEFVLTDAIGRDWQCGTLQVDFILPARLDATYIGEDGNRHQAVMLHRAILGSFERFIGILIEHHAGRFPLWLAPTQAVVATITSDGDDYANKVSEQLGAAGLRVTTDLRNEKINYKVREHSLAKVPAILVVGSREAGEGTVSMRRLGSRDQKTVQIDEAIRLLAAEAKMPGG